MNHFPVLLQRNLHAQCASQAVRACFVRSCCNVVVQGVVQSRKKTILMRFLKGFLKGKLLTPKLRKSADIITIAAWMQPLHYDLQSSDAKDNSITHAAAAPSNLDAATTMRSAETELQNTIELRATASEIAAPKPDLDAKAEKRRFWSTF